jgi:hypothetical protein
MSDLNNKFRDNIAKTVLFILVLTVGIVGIFSFYRKVILETNAQTVDASFYLSPSSQELKKGCQYTTQIMVDPGSNTSNAANIYVEYDPSKIEIIDSNSSLPGKQIAVGNAYEAFADNVVDETEGIIRLTGFSIMYNLQDVKSFGAIRFRSINDAETANFEIWFEGAGDTLDSNIAETNTSDDILATVNNASYTFVDGPCVEDTKAPVITPEDPTHYEIEVPLDSDLNFRVCDNRTWDSGVDADTIEIIINGEVYTTKDVEFVSIDGDPDCYDVTVDPPQDFPEDEAVSVTYKASDFKGNQASKSIIFNIPPEFSECVEELYETREILQECEDRTIFEVLPEGGVEELVKKNETVVDTVSAIPAVTGIASLLPTLGFSIFEIPYYIMQLFLWFLNLLGVKKKGKPWGIVYDSVTKAPITRAVVRLFSQGKLVESRVTDVNGVFYMTPEEGIYTLIASKNGYRFPSTNIVGEHDGPRKNVYKGGPYEVKKDKDIVKLSVPLDPVKASPFKVLFKKSWSFIYNILNKLNPILLLIGMLISGVVYYFTKDPLNLLWLGLNTLFLILHFYVKHLVRSRWGYVVDSRGNPVAGIEIGLYDKTYNRLIDNRVTDEKGRYSFVVPGDTYNIKPKTNSYVIDDPKNEGGYNVGKKTKGDISITQKIVVRRV